MELEHYFFLLLHKTISENMMMSKSSLHPTPTSLSLCCGLGWGGRFDEFSVESVKYPFEPYVESNTRSTEEFLLKRQPWRSDRRSCWTIAQNLLCSSTFSRCAAEPRHH
jgi:hypothetical protein